MSGRLSPVSTVIGLLMRWICWLDVMFATFCLAQVVKQRRFGLASPIPGRACPGPCEYSSATPVHLLDEPSLGLWLGWLDRGRGVERSGCPCGFRSSASQSMDHSVRAFGIPSSASSRRTCLGWPVVVTYPRQPRRRYEDVRHVQCCTLGLKTTPRTLQSE